MVLTVFVKCVLFLSLLINLHKKIFLSDNKINSINKPEKSGFFGFGYGTRKNRVLRVRFQVGIRIPTQTRKPRIKQVCISY